MSMFSRCINHLRFLKFEATINKKTKMEHSRILSWATTVAQQADEEGEDESLFETSCEPIVRRGHLLRCKTLKMFRNKYAGRSNMRILIHTPPPAVSPGGFSLFSNMAQSISYLGVPVCQLGWDIPTAKMLEEFRPTILLTSDSREYLNRLDWASIKDYKNKQGLFLGLTASLAEYGNTPLQERLEWATNQNVDFFYSFRSPEYLASRKEYSPFYDHGYPIFSIEFGANPFLYYPVPGIERDLDYIFLASTNRDKWQRYFEYLPNILSSYHGFLDGPGWRHLASWASQKTHRFLYARAKVGINLHIPDSINWPCELNERTYILAACGVPQVVDNALLLPERFSGESMFIAVTPGDYVKLFHEVLHAPKEANARACKALEEVYARHTCFHRAEGFINRLMLLSNV